MVALEAPGHVLVGAGEKLLVRLHKASPAAAATGAATSTATATARTAKM